MNNTTQKLREAINRANPSLLELKQGCELNNPKAIEWARRVSLVCYNTNNGMYHFVEPDGSVFKCYQKLVDTFEILGIKPELNHLLIAIGKKYDGMMRMVDGELSLDFVMPFIDYDLTKRPLEQSQEVQEALLKLIG